MAFTVNKYPDEPILVATLEPNYASRDEADAMRGAILDALSACNAPVYLIFDLQAQLGLDDLLTGTNRSTRGETPMLRHPNIRQIIAVTDNQMLRLAAKGMRAATFGNLDVQVFGTLDEALAYARSGRTASN